MHEHFYCDLLCYRNEVFTPPVTSSYILNLFIYKIINYELLACLLACVVVVVVVFVVHVLF